MNICLNGVPYITNLVLSKKGTPQNMGSLKKIPALRDNYSMEVDLLKYLHTSYERANIVKLFQWHDGQHCCTTGNEGIFTCDWSYCVLHVFSESFDIFIESELFRLVGVHFSGGKRHEAQTLPFKACMVKLLAEHCERGKRCMWCGMPMYLYGKFQW